MNSAIIVSTSTNIETYQKVLSECLKTTDNFTDTVYTNVCTGQVYQIGNGDAGTIGTFLLVAFGLVIVLGLAGMFLRMLFD